MRGSRLYFSPVIGSWILHTKQIVLCAVNGSMNADSGGAAGGEPLAKGPVRLGERPDSDYLALVRDPDGNLIELIGPKR